MTDYLRLISESRNLTLRIMDEWNHYGRAEFMIRYEKALKESRIRISKIYQMRYNTYQSLNHY